MTTVVLGCDSNGVNDAECQNTVESAIKSAGYEVKKLGINANDFADYSYKGEAKGKIGVYLMAGSLISFLDGSDSYFDYCIFGIRGDVSKHGTEEGFKTLGVPKDHDGNYSHPRYDECAGKPYSELNNLFKGKCVAVPGETPEKLAQNIVSALSGKVPSGGQNQNQDNGDDEEEWDDKDNFTPHKGNIMEIKPYTEISSISFDKSYDSPTGSGSVELLYHAKDYRFIYKGVAMKLKLRRSCDKEWSATGLEEPYYDENEKFFKEHVPTNELLEELGLPNYRKQKPLGQSSSDVSNVNITGTDNTDSSSDSSNNTSSNSGGSSSSGSVSKHNVNASGSTVKLRRLSGKYINTLSPSDAKTLARQTKVFDKPTIKRLLRRSMGLYW